MDMHVTTFGLSGVAIGTLKSIYWLVQVKYIMHKLLKGVGHLHENWILHRNLHPSNILYTDERRVKICTTGSARKYGSPLRPYTRLVGTLNYCAPELILSTEGKASLNLGSCHHGGQVHGYNGNLRVSR
jgi:serine/threonine protein kinase